MNRFCCFSSTSSENNATRNAAGPSGTSTETPPTVASTTSSLLGSTRSHDSAPRSEDIAGGSSSQAPNSLPNMQTFTFRELAAATKKFRKDRVITEGHFGKFYKGIFGKTGQVFAVKQLNMEGVQGRNEFLAEVSALSKVCHANVLDIVGYCADGDQRLLVYEYMPRGSLEDHLFDVTGQRQPLDWFTRMQIAYGAALGLQYLHERFNPPVTYRDLRTSNIFLDENFNPKLSAFGLVHLRPVREDAHANMRMRVIGNFGYCAPDYVTTGQWKPESDVFCFGILLLELISGRRAVDAARPREEQCLVKWAAPIFRDQTRHAELIDPLIKDDCSSKTLARALAVAEICLQETACHRPIMTDVVLAFSAFFEPANETIFPASSGVLDRMSIAEGSSISGN